MNERGDAILLSVAALAVLTGLMLLCSMELERSFRRLHSRTKLFLCVKEAKGELEAHLVAMGRSNWAIKNIERAKWIAALVPGLQGAAMKAEKARKLLKRYQDLRLLKYLGRLRRLSNKGCRIDPRLLATPYEITPSGHRRNASGEARRRSEKWTYYFGHLPYVLALEVDLKQQEGPKPRIGFRSEEKGAKWSSSSSWGY